MNCLSESVIVCTAGLLLVAALALNQPATPAAGEKLTLDQALALAEQGSPLLQGAVAQTEAAQASVQTARSFPNPQFDFYAGHQHARAVANPAVPGLLQHYSAFQLMETPAVRRTRLDAAKHGQRSGQFALAGVRRSVRSTVKHTFYDVLRRREEINHAEENLKLAEDLRRRTEVQVSVGEAAKLELTRAEAEIATAQALVKSARIQYITAVSLLRAAIGVPLPPDIEPQGDFSGSVTLPPLETIRATALGTHPLIAQAKAEISRAESIVKNQRALRVPQPSLFGEYSRI
jgi:outer membrane protein, heavy metal efflux system